MSSCRSAVLAAAALLCGGCGGSALSTARPPHAISPAAHTVLTTCDDHPEHRPRTVVLACADAGDTLTGLTWSGWGAPTAHARGFEVVDVCVPSCVAGRTARLAATVQAARLTLQDTSAAYRSLVVTVTGHRPAGLAYRTRYEVTGAGPEPQGGG